VELPRINEIYQELSGQYDNLQVIAIEVNNDRAGAEAFITEHDLQFLFSEADRTFVKDKFNTAGYPNSFIIDAEGVIRQHHLGFRAGDELHVKEELLELLN